MRFATCCRLAANGRHCRRTCCRRARRTIASRCGNGNGTLVRIHHAFHLATLEQGGREASPSAAIVDSQSAKAAQKGALRATRRVSTQATRSRDASATSSPRAPPERTTEDEVKWQQVITVTEAATAPLEAMAAGRQFVNADLVPLYSDYDSLVLGSRTAAGSG
jgi:hypothetical protein